MLWPAVTEMKYHSKDALLQDIRTTHDQLCGLLIEIPEPRWQDPGVWGDEWTVADLVAHLAEWQRMFLVWYEDGSRGAAPRMPAPGYKWNETPRLNLAIRENHRSRPGAAVMTDFESGYQRILQIADGLSIEQLLAPGAFAWTGRNPLTTYLGPNTASHYRFAIRVIRRWLKAGGARDRPNRR